MNVSLSATGFSVIVLFEVWTTLHVHFSLPISTLTSKSNICFHSRPYIMSTARIRHSAMKRGHSWPQQSRSLDNSHSKAKNAQKCNIHLTPTRTLTKIAALRSFGPPQLRALFRPPSIDPNNSITFKAPQHKNPPPKPIPKNEHQLVDSRQPLRRRLRSLRRLWSPRPQVSRNLRRQNH
jgi:hypothetical protein